jgi:peptidoglycan/LPS O-acetylase OafA/YrhL
MNRNDSLDSLRFLAALCVAVAHCLTAFSDKPYHAQTLAMIDFSNLSGVFARVVQMLFNAHSAVIVFFVLSGFVLTQSLKRLESENYAAEFFYFVTRRIYRIFPALIFSVLVLGYFINYPSGILIQNMLLMDTSINGVAWTLQVELAGCLVVFATFMAMRALPVSVVFLVVGLGFLFFTNYLPQTFSKYLPAFLVGSLISYVGKFSLGKITAYTSLCVMLVSDMVFGYKTNISILVQTVCAGLLILSISNFKAMEWLNRSVLAFLGKISFSFYLMHLVGMILTRQLCAKLGIPLGQMSMLENTAVYVVISIPITVLISIFTYQLIEQPMNKVGAEMAKSLRGFLKFRPRVDAAHSNG